MKKFHYGWIICAGCTVLLFFTVGLTSTTFTIYMPFFIEAGGLSQAQGGVLIMVRSLTSLLSIPFTWAYHRSVGIRAGLSLSVVALAGAFYLYAVADSLFFYCLASALAGLCYTLGGTIPVSMLITRWFQSDRALAIGICASGSGAAAILVPPLLIKIVAKTSLKRFLTGQVLATLVLAVGVFFVLRGDPQDKRLTPYCRVKKSKNDRTALAFGNTTDNTAMYLMFIAVFVMGMGLFGAMQYIASFLKSAGFGEIEVSALVSTYGVTLLFGKIIFGRATDLFGGRRSSLLFFAVGVVGSGIICVVGEGGRSLAFAAMLCFGFSLPLVSVGVPVFARDVGTEENYADTMSKLQFAFMLGSTAVGAIPGAIADATGSYVAAYILLTVLIAVSMLLVQISYAKASRMEQCAQAIRS